jgi:hypothetical protein
LDFPSFAPHPASSSAPASIKAAIFLLHVRINSFSSHILFLEPLLNEARL